jgi:hypothetical protein
MILPQAGVQTALVQKKLLRQAPSLAILSMLGVWNAAASREPQQLIAFAA